MLGRRHDDGSDLLLWNILLDVLQEYDGEWISTLEKKYPTVQNIWKTPPTITSNNSIFLSENRSYVKLNNIAAFFETVVDGHLQTGFSDHLVLTTGKHQITVLNCLEKDMTGYCECQTFDTNLEAKKQI